MIEDNASSKLGLIEVVTQNSRGHSPEYRLAIYSTILYYIKEAIHSERCTMRNMLISQGDNDLANILKELK